jgi:adenylosuccinate lyase
LPDATTLACYALRRMTRLVGDLVVDEERMRENVDALRGLVYSQRVLHALIEGGAMREEAYGIVQRHALAVWEGGPDLRASLAADPAVRLSTAQLDAAFDPEPYLAHVEAIYARNGITNGEEDLS